MLLAIDTSTRYAGVALAEGGRVLSCRVWYSQVNHTLELMPAVDQSLKSQNIGVAELEGIAIALGPGGFSALRVGMSVAKGLAVISRKPLMGVGTLDLEAFPYRGCGMQVCALLDAGRNEVASALFGLDGNRIREDLINPTEEILKDIAEPTLFCGEGVQGRTDLIVEQLGPKSLLMAHPSAASRLWSLAFMAQARLDAGESDDLAELQPDYLRMPSIGGPKQRDREPQRS